MSVENRLEREIAYSADLFQSHVLAISSVYAYDIYVTKSEYVFVVIGISYTFGMFLDNIMETFGTSRSATSMIGSIEMGVT